MNIRSQFQQNQVTVNRGGGSWQARETGEEASMTPDEAINKLESKRSLKPIIKRQGTKRQGARIRLGPKFAGRKKEITLAKIFLFAMLGIALVIFHIWRVALAYNKGVENGATPSTLCLNYP